VKHRLIRSPLRLYFLKKLVLSKHFLLDEYLATASVCARLRISSAEMLQALEVTYDQRFFFTTAPVLDLSLTFKRISFGRIGLGIDEANRAVFKRV